MSEQVIRLTSQLVSTPTEYARLREQAPLVRVALPEMETQSWLITRYEDVEAALTDPRFIRDASKLPGHEGEPNIVDKMLEGYQLPKEYHNYFDALVLTDGEEHARKRGVITRAFTANRLKALRPRVEQITHDLYQTLSAKGEADLIGEFTTPLAGAALCELVGIEEADRPRIFEYFTFLQGGDPTELVPKLTAFVDHLKGLIAQRRAEPADDLLSTLVRLSDEEGDFDEDDIIATLFQLINTGIVPPSQFMADSILALLGHLDQVERLRAEPGLITTTAVPELLRFTTSVPLGATLYATEDLEFCGKQLKQGDAVTASLAAANYDPSRYSEPLKLDLTRQLGRGVGHMTLGYGPHYCIGSGMARLIGEVVLEQLFIKHEGLSLAVARDELKYQGVPGQGLYLLSLPVRF